MERYLASLEMKDHDKKQSDIWFAQDKGRHMIGSLYGTVLIGQIGGRFSGTAKNDARLIAIGTMVSFGLFKEIYDGGKRDNHFSWRDMTANMIGIMVGYILLGIH